MSEWVGGWVSEWVGGWVGGSILSTLALALLILESLSASIPSVHVSFSRCKRVWSCVGVVLCRASSLWSFRASMDKFPISHLIGHFLKNEQ